MNENHLIPVVADTMTTTATTAAIRCPTRLLILRWIDCSAFCDLSNERTIQPSSVARSTPMMPTIYILNIASIVNLLAIEQLTAEMIDYDVDIAMISETHLKKKHADTCVDIAGYALFRRDRPGRKGGGVAIFTRRSLAATEWTVQTPEPRSCIPNAMGQGRPEQRRDFRQRNLPPT